MRFAFSLAEQGFGSILTFAVNIWLIRNGAEAAYGAYVFWLSVAWVSGVPQGTLVLAHLSRLPSARDHMAERRGPERLMLSLSLAVLALTTVCVAIGDALLRHAGSDLASPAAVLFVPAFLLFQYARTFAFSRQRPGLAAGLTGTILAAVAVALAVDHLFGGTPDAGRVLLITGLCYGIVSAAAVLLLLNGMRPMWRPAEIRRHHGAIHGSAWLLLGAGSNEVTGRLYSFVTVGRYGTEALAVMSAVQVLIRPAWLLSSAWSSVGFPEISAHRAREDRAGVVRSMVLGGTVTAAASLIWSAVVMAAWPAVSTILYHGKYADVGPLIVLWGINVVVGSLAVALNVGMLAMGLFRQLALVDFAGAVVTVAVLAVVVAQWSYPWSIAATIVGQVVQIALMVGGLKLRLAQPLAPQPG